MVKCEDGAGFYADTDWENVASFLKTELIESDIGAELVISVEDIDVIAYNELPEFSGF